MPSFKPAFSLSSFILIKKLLHARLPRIYFKFLYVNNTNVSMKEKDLKSLASLTVNRFGYFLDVPCYVISKYLMKFVAYFATQKKEVKLI